MNHSRENHLLQRPSQLIESNTAQFADYAQNRGCELQSHLNLTTPCPKMLKVQHDDPWM